MACFELFFRKAIYSNSLFPKRIGEFKKNSSIVYLPFSYFMVSIAKIKVKQ